ncbi:MAG: hypothetical protein KGJ05_10090, partial [Alphaproteobacteria bacterium]|nr:hypothetical protein [Alphaproteobacteria bacterium]
MRSGKIIWRLACAIAAALLLMTSPALATKSGKTILFLIKLNGPHRATDDAITKHLEQLGFTVTLGDDTKPPTADGADIIAISATCQGKWILDAYKNASVPIVTWKPWLYPWLGMTGKRIDVNFGEGHKAEQGPLFLVNAPDPLSAHLPNG